MHVYEANNEKSSRRFDAGEEDESVGVVTGDERSYINMMNRAYESTKKLVLRYNECYNTNIDCEEEQ